MKHGNWIIIVNLILIAVACGLYDPKVVVYDSDSSGGGGADDGSDSRLTEFKATIGSAAKTVCASCHATTPIGSDGGKLSASDDSQNRTTLFAYVAEESTTCDPAAFFDKIAGRTADGHGGGDKSADMPTEKIQQWLEAETDCP